MILSSTSKSKDGIKCLLFPSLKTAEACCSFVRQQFLQSSSKAEVHHITEVFNTPLAYEVFAVFFPEDQKTVMLNFWIFTGLGISTRLAEQCLLRLSGDEQHESKLGIPRHPGHEYSEYYQKHIPLSSVKDAKDKIRTRLSGIIKGRGNIRGVCGVSAEDVYLYPTGMTAIWHCHKLLEDTIGLRIGPDTKYAHIKSVTIVLSRSPY